MRFLIQTPHLSDEISGVQTYVDIMAGALRRASVDVEVISTRNTGWKVLWAAVRRADVVHLNSNHLSLALMARMLKKKLILKYHFEFWMAPVSGDCSALKWPQRLRREIAFRWNQGQGQGLRLSRLRYFCDSAARAILRVGVAALANDRLFCSRALAQSANLPGKSTIAYNPVKVDSEMPTVVRTDPPLFAFVGRIERNKGCDILMNAAAILKTQRPELNFQLVIVGDGPERSMLESQAASMEVDCHFTGRVSWDDACCWMRKATAVVVPTRGTEAASYVAIEALTAGTPVIGARIGGIPEMVMYPELIFPPEDAPALAEKLAWMLTEPEMLREQPLSHFDARRFTPQFAVKQLLEIAAGE